MGRSMELNGSTSIHHRCLFRISFGEGRKMWARASHFSEILIHSTNEIDPFDLKIAWSCARSKSGKCAFRIVNDRQHALVRTYLNLLFSSVVTTEASQPKCVTPEARHIFKTELESRYQDPSCQEERRIGKSHEQPLRHRVPSAMSHGHLITH